MQQEPLPLGVPCFVCRETASHEHHVVPVSLMPNDATVPLCGRCHALAHGRSGFVKMQELSKRGLARRRAAGLPVSGKAPFGTRWEAGRTVPDEIEQAALARLRELFEQGLNHVCIAEHLNAEGYRRRRGLMWSRMGVLKQCRSLGLRMVPRKPLDDSLPPCPACGGERHWAADGPGRRWRRCDRCVREKGRRAFAEQRSARWARLTTRPSPTLPLARVIGSAR
jgi:hypothetical protein